MAPHVPPDSNALLPILGLGYPPLLLCNMIAVILWLLLKSRWVLLSALTLLLGYQSCTTLLNLSIPDKPTPHAFKVASYNANFAKRIAQLALPDQPPAEKKYLDFLSSLNDISVLCVQEDGFRTESLWGQAMQLAYSHRVEGLSVSIYSKFPIIDKGMVNLNSTTANTCLWADIDALSGIFRIYTTHLEANRADGTVPAVIVETAPEEMSNSALLGIVKHHVKFSAVRAAQAQTIADHANTSPHPTIICGDFNETPQSYVYTILKGDRQDTFQEEGRGIASTFGEKIPALRIDHMFVDEDLEVLDHSNIKSQYSDHYMIVAEVEAQH